jgi:hypothetical protein
MFVVGKVHALVPIIVFVTLDTLEQIVVLLEHVITFHLFHT